MQYVETHPTARKRHVCDTCGLSISPGCRYTKQVQFDHGVTTWRECSDCSDWREVFDLIGIEVIDDSRGEFWPLFDIVSDYSGEELTEMMRVWRAERAAKKYLFDGRKRFIRRPVRKPGQRADAYKQRIYSYRTEVCLASNAAYDAGDAEASHYLIAELSWAERFLRWGSDD